MPIAEPGPPDRVLTYTLTRADALVWESLPTELRGWRKAAFLAWMAAGALWLLVLPDGWITEGTWRQVAAVLAVAALHYLATLPVMTFARHRRAARRVPHPLAMACMVWPDRLVARQPDGSGVTQVITPLRIRQVVVMPGHLFLDQAEGVLILPLSAFADPADLRAFAARWDALSNHAAD